MATKEEMKAYQKDYYLQNRDRIRDMMKEKVYCKACKAEVTKHNYARHKQTKRHLAKKATKQKKTNEELNDAVLKAVKKLMKTTDQ